MSTGILAASFLLAAGLMLAASPAAAGKYHIIYDFPGFQGDGGVPVGDLVADSAGRLYGTTSGGGNSELAGGIVFRLSKAGKGQLWSEEVLYDFEDQSKGCILYAGVTLGGSGEVYGVTNGCGQYGQGSVFRLDGELAVLHSFGPNTRDGTFSRAGLAFGPAGLLYGTTSHGGDSNADAGTAFSISSSGDEYAVIHKFGKSGDGISPWFGRLLYRNGDLFGVTILGGQLGHGSVYSLSPRNAGGWKERVLYRFQGVPDFDKPNHGVISDPGGVLYGCGGGGTHFMGGVYSLKKSGSAWTETPLYNFGDQANDPRGDGDCALALGSGGKIFGTTANGGPSDDGTVFELDPPAGRGATWTETVLHSFDHTSGDGYRPAAPLLKVGGIFYGVTQYGGAAGLGTVFSIKP